MIPDRRHNAEDKPKKTTMNIKSLPVSDLKLVAVCELDSDNDGNVIPLIHIIDQQAYDESTCELHGNHCNCCGHRLKYTCLIQHIPTKTLVPVGRDCARTIDGLRDLGLVDGISVALAQRRACDKKEQAFRSNNHAACAALDWAATGINRTAKDIYEKLRKYGSLSEKQVAFLIGIYNRDIATRATATGTVPVGKQAIEGTILSVKPVGVEVRSDYNRFYTTTHYKVLVDLGNGAKIFGKCPPKVYALGDATGARIGVPEKGQRVTFSATCNQSDKDPLFGFFERATKWTVL